MFDNSVWKMFQKSNFEDLLPLSCCPVLWLKCPSKVKLWKCHAVHSLIEMSSKSKNTDFNRQSGLPQEDNECHFITSSADNTKPSLTKTVGVEQKPNMKRWDDLERTLRSLYKICSCFILVVHLHFATEWFMPMRSLDITIATLKMPLYIKGFKITQMDSNGTQYSICLIPVTDFIASWTVTCIFIFIYLHCFFIYVRSICFDVQNQLYIYIYVECK